MGTLTTVKNLRTSKRVGGVYIGRPGYLGNPFKLKVDTPAERAKVLKRFERWFYARLKSDEEYRETVHLCEGEVLWCYCDPKPCHGHVIAKYLNGRAHEQEEP